MSTIQISALPAASAITADDLLPIEHDPSGTPVTQKATAAVFAAGVRGIAGAYVTTNIVPSGATSLTVNATQADVDVRIKGDTDAALVFLDAGTNRVGIGTATPTTLLDVSGTLKATAFTGSGASLTGVLGTAASFQSLASDPASPTKGDVWYNTTTNLFRGRGVTPTAWATTGSVSTGRRSVGGTGTAGAAIAVGGYNDGTATYYANVDIYNGSTWSAGTAFDGAWHSGNICGTPTATISMSGVSLLYSPPYTLRCYTYNGTTWTLITSCAVCHSNGCAFGASSTSAGQSAGEYPTTATTELYNGTSWSTQGSMSAGDYSNRGGGTTSAAWSSGGATSPTNLQTFNGTTWASGTSLLVSTEWHAALGTTTSALAAAGKSAGVAIATTQAFNGTSWTASATLSQARQGCMGGGASSSSGMVGLGTVSFGASLVSAEVLTAGSLSNVTFTQA